MGLLFDERPLVLSPTLAKELGNLNEAVFVQQLHYWLERKKQSGKNFVDGRYWVYNSVEDWLKQFPWLSSATLRRTIESLEKKGYVIKDNFNQKKMDRTSWYSLNYEKIMEIDEKTKRQKEENAMAALDAALSEDKNESPQTIDNKDFSRIAQNEQMQLSKSTNASAQNEQMQMLKMSKSICSKRANPSAHFEQSNTIDFSLNYPKTTSSEISCADSHPSEDEEEVAEEIKIAEQIIKSYNELCPSFLHCIKLTAGRLKLIRDLFHEGITLEQIIEAFKQAERSDFLTGRKPGADWTRFDFDWLIQPSSVISLLEGKFDNVSPQAKKRIEKYQASFAKAADEKDINNQTVTQKEIEEYPSYLRDALKRHCSFPDNISSQEVLPS